MIDLVSLADKYEVRSFCNEDPSQFLRWYPLSKKADVETASFITAMLSFGSRPQFISKVKYILETADKTSGSITAWIKQDAPGFPKGSWKFYRFYSYDDLRALFCGLKNILFCSGNEKPETLGNYFKNIYTKTKEPLYKIICQSFPDVKIVPKGKNSANKRIHMFLRWMVRTDSPVDLGIWKWYPKSELIIPLDVHVMQESVKMGLLPQDSKADFKTALKLTQKMKEYFPGDPCRADFALFGAGVN